MRRDWLGRPDDRSDVDLANDELDPEERADTYRRRGWERAERERERAR